MISHRGIARMSRRRRRSGPVSSTPTGARHLAIAQDAGDGGERIIVLRSTRVPPPESRRLSRTDGSSKCGVTMVDARLRAECTAAVRRSLRHHCTPVKYTSDAPGSMSSAPMPCLPMSARAFVDAREIFWRGRWVRRPLVIGLRPVCRRRRRTGGDGASEASAARSAGQRENPRLR